MNAKKCKLLRRAAEYTGQPATYEPNAIHHLTEFPAYEMYAKVVRTWNRITGYAIREVQTLRRKHGKPILLWHWKQDEQGAPQWVPQTQLAGVPKPRLLAKDCPRRLYKFLKKLERTDGLDSVFKQLQAEGEKFAIGSAAV